MPRPPPFPAGPSFSKNFRTFEKNDPAEFKKVTADIAAKLQAAGQKDGGSQGQALISLAAKFQQASQTGTLAPLQSGHHGGHHHGGPLHASDPTTAAPATSAAIAAYTQSSAQSSAFAQAGSIIGQALTQALGSAVA